MKQFEILAPAGDQERLLAAIQNGADAVYLGGPSFGARAYAGNFDYDTLPQALALCRLYGVKAYIAVNTLIKEVELQACLDYVGWLINIGADALIIQDLGLLATIRAYYPTLEIHTSTQMTTNSCEDVHYLQTLAVDRVVVSRELPTKEIAKIAQTGIDIEAFVHGALCVSYSGQCLMSSIIGGRSGNRGRCAQPCRMEYSLETLDGIVKKKGSLLSTKDLSTIQHLPTLFDSGIYSLKIEGRMKRPEYVALATRGYRLAALAALGEISTDIAQHELELFQLFNRDFTSGYLLGENGQQIINEIHAKNKGTVLGSVVSFDRKRNRLKILLEDEINKGDGLSIGEQVGRIHWNNQIVMTAPKQATIEIDWVKPITTKTVIYKTANAKLLAKAQQTYAKTQRKVPVTMTAEFQIGSAPTLTLQDGTHTVTTQATSLCTHAIQTPLSLERIQKQLQKLGATVYTCTHATVHVDENLSFPISELNTLRRQACEQLDELRQLTPKHIPSIQLEHTTVLVNPKATKKLAVLVSTLEQLTAALSCGVDDIYYNDFKTLNQALELVPTLAFVPPRVLRAHDYKMITAAAKMGVKRLVATTIGCLTLSDDFEQIIANYNLNIFNHTTVQQLTKHCQRICLSPELTLDEINQVTSHTQTECEYVGYSHLPVMTTEACPFKLADKQCELSHCGLKEHQLHDRVGKKWRLSPQPHCRMIIHNPEPVSAIKALDFLGVQTIRLEFFHEDAADVVTIISAFQQKIAHKPYDWPYQSITGNLYAAVE
ncbi:MAG: DUF3656 domain-containing U32 family peptidase [Culicoidibacterales bacterium]